MMNVVILYIYLRTIFLFCINTSPFDPGGFFLKWFYSHPLEGPAYYIPESFGNSTDVHQLIIYLAI